MVELVKNPTPLVTGDRALVARDGQPQMVEIGTAATRNEEYFATAGQGSLAETALQSSNNLSDLADAGTARTNLGLGGQYATRAEFVDDVDDGYAPADGTVVSAGGVQYVRDASATAIADLPGWLPFGALTPGHFGAIGDGSTSDVTAFQSAFDWMANNGGGILIADDATAIWFFDSTCIIRGDNITVEWGQSRIEADFFNEPLFLIGDPTDEDNHPDEFVSNGGRFLQREEVVDLVTQSSIVTGIAQWQVAGVFSRIRGAGTTTTITGAEADNFVNFITNRGDISDEYILAGPLIIRDVVTRRMNFGLLDRGCDGLFVDGWDDYERVAIQFAGGSIMPPHTIYAYRNPIRKYNYKIFNVRDFDTVHSNPIKMRSVTGFLIRNISGRNSPQLIEMMRCYSGVVQDCDAQLVSTNPALPGYQPIYLVYGCRDVIFSRCNGEVSGAIRLFQSRPFDDDEGFAVSKNIVFDGTAYFVGGAGYAITLGDDDDTNVTLRIVAGEENNQIGILRDRGAGSNPIGAAQIKVESINAISSGVVTAFLASNAVGACIEIDPLTIHGVTGFSNSGSGGGSVEVRERVSSYRFGGSRRLEVTSPDTGSSEFVASSDSSRRLGYLSYDHSSHRWTIGTNGSAKVAISVNGLEMLSNGTGIILNSPDGQTTRTLTIDNNGDLVVS